MPAKVRVIHMRQKADPSWTVINACSNSKEDWQLDLSPFKLGPCWLYGAHWARTMENAWQYSKLYSIHADNDGAPTHEYYKWAQEGWDNPKAVRYPMGKGAKPLYCIWDDVMTTSSRGSLLAPAKLGYIEARKQIYGPLYRASVMETPGYSKLKTMQMEMKDDQILAIRDFDGYDSVALGMSLTQVLNLPAKKMGHAFVLAMLLTGDAALNELGKVGQPTHPQPERWTKKEEAKDEES